MEETISVNGVPIRLTYERWYHIVENHDEMASYFHEVLDVVGLPDLVIQGNGGALKAARNLGKRRWMVVVYREKSKDDGFVVTSFLLDTRPKGRIAWQRR